ncbi:hypothetical protein ACLKA7_000515 [Drosophila subpalustris]
MIRDRLPELIAAREKWNGGVEEEEEEPEFERDMELDAFFELVEEIRKLLDNLQISIAEVQEKQSDQFSLVHYDSKAQQLLQVLMDEIQKNSNSVREKIRIIEEAFEDKELLQNNSALLRMKKIQHSGLLTKFVEIITDFDRSQCKYNERFKARIKRQLEITRGSVNNVELDALLEKGNPSLHTLFVDPEISKQLLLNIQDRDADIKKLETSIREMHSLFMDMRVLIESQDDLTNSIQYNVTHAAEYVESAKKNIKRAVRYEIKDNQEIRKLLDNLQISIAEVQEKQSDPFSLVHYDSKAKQLLQVLMDEIQKNSNSVREKIRIIEEAFEDKELLQNNSALLRMKKIQHSGLLTKFVEIITDFDRSQCKYNERFKARIKRQLEITRGSVNNVELDALLEKGNPSLHTLFVDPEISKQLLLNIQDRDADIKKLETSIREMHSLFMDMRVLIESQDDLTNSIQYNVTHAAEYVESAKKNIKRAVRYEIKDNPKLGGKLSAILEKMDQHSEFTEEVFKKVDRQTTELVTLRSEVASIKTKVCG